VQDQESERGPDRRVAPPEGGRAEQRDPSAAGRVLHLQRSAGNGAVAQLMATRRPATVHPATVQRATVQRATVQRDKPTTAPAPITPATAPPVPGGAPAPAITVIAPPPPKGQLIRHTGTGVTFTDDPAYVKFQLEAYADKKGLDSIGAFESSDELYITDVGPNLANPATPTTAPPDPAYLKRVIGVVHAEIVSLRAHLDTFRTDFQRRANDTLQTVLTDSSARLDAEKEKYGIKTEQKSFLFLKWQKFSGAGNDAAQQMLTDVTALKAKLPAVREAKEHLDTVLGTSGNWFYNPASIDEAKAKFAPIQKDYDTARHKAESASPMLQAYNLDAHRPETEDNLEKLSSKDADDRAEHVGKELATRQENIEKVRKASENKEYVWKLDKIVGLTRQLPDIKSHPLLTNPGLQASVAIEKAATVQADAALVSLGLGLVVLGLGLIAAAPTGGLSVGAATAVSAAGTAEAVLQVAVAYKAYKDYELGSAEAATDYENAQSLSQEAPDLFWLALDMIGAAASVAGGAKAVSSLFKQVAALKEEALTAKAVKMAGASKGLPGAAEDFDRVMAELKATGDKASPGAGERLAKDVDQDPGAARTRKSSAADPDADPPTVRKPEAGAANQGLGVSRAEAVGQYFTEIQANPDREYGLIQHAVTKQFRVVIGGLDHVNIPGEFGEGWHFVRHYHPNIETNPITGVLGPIAQDSKKGVLGARLPSVGSKRSYGDMLASRMTSQARGGAKVSETLDWFDPATNRMRTTRFGYNPDIAAPYWIEVVQGKGQIRREFANLTEATMWADSVQ
jgi:hypothetical protein